MATSDAVSQATRLGEIGFPEFTAKLITDTFDALVAANIRQTEAYMELVKQMSKSLSDFINDTKDDIGGELLLQFAARCLPDPGNVSGTIIRKDNAAALTANEATAINNAVKVEGVQDKVVSEGEAVNGKFDVIMEAIAKRISADKYSLFREMVKMGVLRLVVEHGVIETKLTFNTYGSNFYQSNASQYHRDDFAFRSSARTGSFLSPWVKASASVAYTSMNISSASQMNRDVSGSSVQIFGGVKIDFKTDYQALS